MPLTICDFRCVCRWPRLENKKGECVLRSNKECVKEANEGLNDEEPTDAEVPTTSKESTPEQNPTTTSTSDSTEGTEVEVF